MLVQGTAQVDDRNLDRNRERYCRESLEKLPGDQEHASAEACIRAMLDWYFMRIYVYVRPERVYVWPDGDFTAEPTLYDAHMEEVRSHHSEEPEVERPAPEGGAVAWDERLEELGRRHPTAVLSVVGPDGFPLSSRLPSSPTAAAGRIRLGELRNGSPPVPDRRA